MQMICSQCSLWQAENRKNELEKAIKQTFDDLMSLSPEEFAINMKKANEKCCSCINKDPAKIIYNVDTQLDCCVDMVNYKQQEITEEEPDLATIKIEDGNVIINKHKVSHFHTESEVRVLLDVLKYLGYSAKIK